MINKQHLGSETKIFESRKANEAISNNRMRFK